MVSKLQRVLFIGAMVLSVDALASDVNDGIALCGKCLGTTLISVTGRRTAHAVMVARKTVKDIEEYCYIYHGHAGPKRVHECVGDAPEADEKTYRISANCKTGTYTEPFGQEYIIAGQWGPQEWDFEIEGVRSLKFKNRKGMTVGLSHAEGGISHAVNYARLCF